MEDESDDISAKRDRSPPFPYLGLNASIEHARKLYQVAKSSEVRLAQIAPHWNTTATSGALARYAGALQAYGLIESSGSNDNRKIRITETGRRILEDTRPGVGEELKAAAALRPKLIEELYRLWGRSRPTDDIAKSALQFDYNFTQVAAKRFLVVFDEAIKCLPQSEYAADPIEIIYPPSEITLTPLSRDDSEKKSAVDLEEVSARTTSSYLRKDVFALDEGEVTISMPRSLSRASFEDFVSWLELMKRKAERSVKG